MTGLGSQRLLSCCLAVVHAAEQVGWGLLPGRSEGTGWVLFPGLRGRAHTWWTGPKPCQGLMCLGVQGVLVHVLCGAGAYWVGCKKG